MPPVPKPELYACLEQLDRNEEQKNQLLRYAEYRVGRVRTHVRHADGADLYQEAVLRTAAARRTWDTSAPNSLREHLHRTISSIANHWTRKNWEKNFDIPALPIPALIGPTPKEEKNIDAQRFAHQLKGWIEAHEPEALPVLNLLLDDYKPREIQRELGLSPTDYDRIRQQISRHGKALAARKGLYCIH